MVSETLHDIVYLGGQAFPVRDIVKGSGIVEWESGVKVGPANYDTREHSFFVVLNDWTGGFGYKVLNVRDALGTYWFSNPLNSPYIQTGRVTLSLKQEFVSMTTPTTITPLTELGFPYVERNGWYVFALHDGVYTLTAKSATPTRRASFLSGVTSIISATDPTAGVQRLYLFSDQETEPHASHWLSFDDGVTWEVAQADYLVTKGVFAGKLPLDPLTYTSGGYSTAEYAAAVVAQGGKGPFFQAPVVQNLITGVTRINDGISWDHKVVAVWEDTKIIFQVPCSEDCWLYTIPAGVYLQAAFVAKGKLISSSNITFLTDGHYVVPRGHEPWNHIMDGDCNIIAAIDLTRKMRFIGTGPTWWGEQAPYLRAGNLLYALDFFGRKIYPVDLGNNKPLITGQVWNSDFLLADGWNVFQYDPGGQTSKNIGFPRKWGIPASLLNGSSQAEIVYLVPYDDEIFAIVVEPVEPATYVYRYNGLGWTQFGKKMAGFVAQFGFRATFPLPDGNSFENRSQVLIVPGITTDGGISTATGAGYWQFDLPALSHSPTVGLDHFGDSGAYWYAGWQDGGFFDLTGTLLRMNCEAYFHNGSIEVAYRLDNDPTPEESATWQSLVDIDGNDAVFDADHIALWFKNPDDPTRGIKFRTVQFRIKLIRGADEDDTSSPEYRALVMNYLKTPNLRTRWAFNIDVNAMLETSKSGEDERFYIDGDPPTVESIWAKLTELWINDYTLVPFYIPNVVPSPGINVKIETQGMTIDDFRDAVAGRGAVAMSLVEPVVAG